MTTHDIDIELPPLPPHPPVAHMGGRHTHADCQFPVLYKWAKAYAISAIEADRKRRGEPVGYVMPTDMQKLRAGCHALIGPKSQGADIPLYLDPQPAEPAKEQP